jgi:hypothetical protein
MWAWAALLGGLAVVIAADLVSGPPTIERRAFSRAGDETNLSRRDQRALSLARNFAAWHQAAVAVVRDNSITAGEIAEQLITNRLPAYYRKAGAWRSTIDSNGAVRTSDDGVVIAGIAIGGGAVGRFLAAATGYSGFGGIGWQSHVAATRIDPGRAASTDVAAGHSVRLTVRDNIDPRDKNVP